MTRNQAAVWLGVIVAAFILVLVLMSRNIFHKNEGSIACGDGAGRRIELRDFTRQYCSSSALVRVSEAVC